eukprot:TCALIF_14108-PA protein Name:"Similar to SLN1 Osmosensing histidine protein kinase SLN1 (Saccharomyces cerevisiae (strain ATCC 204508 / S288c))" AED:0.10 eAED:0.10 QI:0/-1/0/1/-1/1/1/0/121
MLKKAGVKAVDVASDGEGAFQAVLSSPAKYDLILMDMHMPRLDGPGAVEKIRLNIPHVSPRTSILAFTAASLSEEEITELRHKGFHGVLFKPFTLSVLRSVLELVAKGDPGVVGDGVAALQ